MVTVTLTHVPDPMGLGGPSCRSGIHPTRHMIACKNLSLDRVPARAASRSCPTFQKLVCASSARRHGCSNRTPPSGHPFAWIDFRIVQGRSHFRRYRLDGSVEKCIFRLILLHVSRLNNEYLVSNLSCKLDLSDSMIYSVLSINWFRKSITWYNRSK